MSFENPKNLTDRLELKQYFVGPQYFSALTFVFDKIRQLYLNKVSPSGEYKKYKNYRYIDYNFLMIY